MRRLLLCCGLFLSVPLWWLSQSLQDHLVLEQLFQNSIADTSGNNRFTSSTGTPNYDLVSGTNVSYLKWASGSNPSKITSDLAWSTNAYNEYTISLWLNTRTQFYNTDMFASSTPGVSSNSFNVYTQCQDTLGNCSMVAPFSGTNGSPLAMNFGFTRNQWIHLLVSKNADTYKVFINGSLHSTWPSYNIKKLDRLIDLRVWNDFSYTYFRVFNKGVSQSEATELYNELSFIRNVGATTGANLKVTWFNNDSFSFELSGLTAPQLPWTATYAYSWDGTNFTNIPAGNFTNLGGGKYSFSVDASSQPYGVVNLSIRITASWNTTTLGTFSATRQESLPVITINNPTTDPAPSKTLTASTDKGALEMRLQTTTECTSVLTGFATYSPYTFSSLEDNGKYICYKATYNGLSSYKLSAKIEGIEQSINTEEIINSDIWEAYVSWRYSSELKQNDTTFTMLNFLSSSTNGQFVDINGDGLVDLLYNNSTGRKAIMLNNGDLTFTLAYKCYHGSGGYYWDCARQ